ncbi:MAG: hypothetical protein EOO62_28430, partial [Hymenobacter sp.]
MATKSTRYVAEGRQEEYDEADAATYPDDQLADEGEAGEPRCASCGELLAWHEESCGTERTRQPELAAVAEPELRAAIQGYAYEVGHLVQPVPEAAARPVIWRGQLRERHPHTGLVQR